ncbi:MAG: GHKL domain-containing protein [Lachnospiraceae bacterium]|jgi:sensor histidine kinase YesM|nr:GHKL domain-containing protein [Lachnospiraceae bacterium]MCI9133896.1 GHKL domain-containing protein [Lachnospiraceae bacterium]
METQVLFYLWWILENSFVNYFIYDFFLCVTQVRGRKYLPLWLIFNGLLTWTVVSHRILGAFLFSILFLILFAKWILKVPSVEIMAPAAIIFTFYTLTEGLSAFTLSWISKSFQSSTNGVWIQLLTPLLFDLLFFAALAFTRKRHLTALQTSISSYLYILLLPCALSILVIRYGLRLDSPNFEQYLSAFGMHTRLAVLVLLAGGGLVIFTTIEVFCKILYFTGREQAASLLESQLASQRIYLEEARQRTDQYASFQHDIDNHLLVLSGLLRDRLFDQAEAYVGKLHMRCQWLSPPVSTGNEVLNVLLQEKFSYAKSRQIKVTWDIHIPSHLQLDDLDLCVLFSNILDNAITAASQAPPEQRFLSLSGKAQAKFLVVEAVNPAPGCLAIRPGTGMGNIRQIAEKYQGTVENQLENGTFRISVLLCSCLACH